VGRTARASTKALDIIRLRGRRSASAIAARFTTWRTSRWCPGPGSARTADRVAVHSAESFAHIGDTGLPIYSGTTTTPLPQLREYMALYRRHLAAAGHPWQPDRWR